MPKLTHFNSYTKFREAISFLTLSNESDDTVVRISTGLSPDGIMEATFTTDRGVTAVTDTTIRSEGLDSEIYVNLHDLCVMCDKGIKENDCALWVDGGRLYIGSCFNEQLEGFESECSIPGCPAFADVPAMDANDSITVEQSTMAMIADSLYEFEYVEIWRLDGFVSFRTGGGKVSIATAANRTSGERQLTDVSAADISVRIPSAVFKVLGMVTDDGSVELKIDTENRRIGVEGDRYSVIHSYEDGQLRSESMEGLSDYMKFDTVAMMATIDMIYGINYLDPIAPVTIVPIDGTTIEFRISNSERYSATITMPGVHVYDTEKSIVLPMDVATMMVRNCGCSSLLMKVGGHGELFMYYQNKSFARKLMFYGA